MGKVSPISRNYTSGCDRVHYRIISDEYLKRRDGGNRCNTWSR